MIVVNDYRRFGFHVTAVPASDGRWNAEVKVRQHFPVDAKTHVETVTCFKVSAALAEQAGERSLSTRMRQSGLEFSE